MMVGKFPFEETTVDPHRHHGDILVNENKDSYRFFVNNSSGFVLKYNSTPALILICVFLVLIFFTCFCNFLRFVQDSQQISTIRTNRRSFETTTTPSQQQTQLLNATNRRPIIPEVFRQRVLAVAVASRTSRNYERNNENFSTEESPPPAYEDVVVNVEDNVNLFSDSGTN